MQITVIIFLEVILLDGYKLIKWAGSATGTNELNGIMKKGKKYISLFNFKGNTVVVVCFTCYYYKVVVLHKLLLINTCIEFSNNVNIIYSLSTN